MNQLVFCLLFLTGRLVISETLNDMSETQNINASSSVKPETVPQVASTVLVPRTGEEPKHLPSEPLLSASTTTDRITGIYIRQILL